MPEDLQQGIKSSFSYLELANRSSQPSDIRSDRAGLAVVDEDLYLIAKGVASKFEKVASGTLAPGSANAISFAWQNPEDSKIIVTRVVLYITSKGGTGATMDVGICGGANQTSDNLIDGVALDATAPFVVDNISDKGTNGKTRGLVDEKGGTNSYITGKILGADCPTLAGKYYIFYIKV